MNAYPLFNLSEFHETDLVQRTLSVDLLGIGEKDILITKGITTAITVDGTMLPINFLGKNPFYRDGMAVYLNPEGIVYLGIEP